MNITSLWSAMIVRNHIFAHDDSDFRKASHAPMPSDMHTEAPIAL